MSFNSYCVQLSKITHAYSRIGLINVKYMISRARLSSLNLSLRITLILVQALEVMIVICSCQVPSFEEVRPKCLRELTSCITLLSIQRSG